MPIELNRQDLIDVLNVVKDGIAKTPISEQLTHVFFLNTHIGCFSGERFIFVKYDTGLTLSTPVAALLPVLDRMDGEKVKLTLDGTTLKLQSKRSRSGIAINLDVSIVQDALAIVQETNPYTRMPPIFYKGLEFCMFSASVDITQGILSCICTRDGVMYSSDDLRITRYNVRTDAEQVNFSNLNIQIFDAEIILKNKPGGYRFRERWTIFISAPTDTRQVIIGITQFEGNFPDVDEFFTMEGTEITLPDALAGVVTEAAHFCEGMFTVDKKLKLTIASDKVICRSENNRTWFEKEIEHAQSIPNEITIVINPLFLSQILEKTRVAVVGDGRVFFVSDDFEHVLALPGV